MTRARRLPLLLGVTLTAVCAACSSAPSTPAPTPSGASGGAAGSAGAGASPSVTAAGAVPDRCEPGTTPPIQPAPASPAPAGAIVFPGGPVGLVLHGGALWAAVPSANQVARVDPARQVITGTVAVAETPLRLAVAGGGIWVTEFRSGTIARFDPATLRVTCRVPVGDQPEGVTTDGSAVWVVLEAPNQLAEIDAATGALRRRIKLPDGGQPRLALHVGGTVWVADYQGNRLVPVEASTGRVGTPVTGCQEPQGMAAAGDRLWVACLGTQEVVAVRLTGTPAVVTRVKVPGDPDGVSADAGRIYVALSNGPGVRAIDVATGKVGPALPLGTSGALTDANVDVVAGGGQVWVGSFNEGKLYHRPAAAVR